MSTGTLESQFGFSILNSPTPFASALSVSQDSRLSGHQRSLWRCAAHYPAPGWARGPVEIGQNVAGPGWLLKTDGFS